jgi:hypothetical protein
MTRFASGSDRKTGDDSVSGTGAYSNATGAGVFDSVPTKWGDGASLFNVKIDVKTP